MLARLIGDSAEFGKYAWGQSLLFLVGMMAALGVPVAAERFIASLSVCGAERAVGAVIRQARSILLCSASALLLVAGLLYILRDEQSSVYQSLAILSVLFAPAVTYASLYRDMARARRWLGLALLPLQVARPVITGLLCLLVWFLSGDDLSGFMALGLAGTSVALILSVQAMVYHRRQLKLHTVTDAPEAAEDYRPEKLLPTAWPIFLGRCAGLSMHYSGVLLLGLLTSPVLAGIYFAADRLAQLAIIPRMVISSVNQQNIAAAHATGDPARLRQVISHGAHGSLWPSLIAALFLIVFAQPLLALFGEEFVDGWPVLVLLALNHAICASFGPAQDLLIMTGNQRLVPRVMGTAALVHVSALVALASSVGPLGAAVAAAISGIGSHFWLRRLARETLGLETSVLAGWKRP
jgi:O-antigen/teichoic acid export membrane protein